jgi:hypothetical protein
MQVLSCDSDECRLTHQSSIARACAQPTIAEFQLHILAVRKSVFTLSEFHRVNQLLAILEIQLNPHAHACTTQTHGWEPFRYIDSRTNIIASEQYTLVK